MSEKVDIFMPMFVADYLADTTDLSTEEHGAYLLLMFAAWRSDGVLPNDPRRLARIAKVPFERWPDMWEAIGRFFSVTSAFVSQGRLAKELARAKAQKEAAIERGRRGAAAKAARSGEQAESKQRASDSPSDEQVNSPPSPSQGSLSLSGSGSSSPSLPPDPSRAIPGATEPGSVARGAEDGPVIWTSNDWLERFKPAYQDANLGLFYGRGAGDGRAIGTLQAILDSLPRDARIAAQLRAPQIFAEFFGDRSPKAVAEKYQFSYFVLLFNGLRAPAKQAVARGSPGGGRQPSTATRDAFASVLNQGKT